MDASIRTPKKGSLWVTSSVLIIHILFIVLSFISTPKLFQKKKSIVVRNKKPRSSMQIQGVAPKIAASSESKPLKTPNIVQPTPIPTPSSQAPVKEAPAPKPKIEKKPVPTAKPATTKKAPTPTSKKKVEAPKPAPQKAAPPVSEQVLKELQKNLENLNKWDAPKTSKTPPPTRYENAAPPKISLQDIVSTVDEDDSPSGYGDILSNFLQESLHLPEYGDVTMSICIKRDGTVINVKVVYAQSEKNKIYLEKTLPKLKFPSLASFNIMDKEKSFQVTFCNKQE